MATSGRRFVTTDGVAAVTRTGLEVLLDEQIELLEGKRVGLIANPTSVDRTLASTIERLRSHPGLSLAALYAPEHGIRGEAQAGEYVPFHYDEHSRLPVFSLYGQAEKPAPGFLADIDATMRAYDTRAAGKQIDPQMLRGVDVLVFDLQDVGTRVYTYVATMAYAMEAAAVAGLPFVVLDRPNPINGAGMEGPLLDYPAQSSFIGLYPVPLRHGMTAGELARLFNERFLARKVELTVVAMANWRRADWFDATGLPWVPPSPNLPSLDAATVYPGQVMLEGTNLSEGRGTTRPFELFGAPWVDGHGLARELNGLELAGVRFREAWFTPTFSKFRGERCGGCQLHVMDRDQYRPVRTALAILHTIQRIAAEHVQFHAAYFDHVLGTSAVREALQRSEPVEKVAAICDSGLEQFTRLRAAYLLYG